MVTKSEKQVIEKYKKRGYFYVHSGAPDFVFYKIKANQNKTTQDKATQINTRQGKSNQHNTIQNQPLQSIDINSIEFVEVKFNGDTLNHEQQIWKHILEQLELNYKLINIQKEQDNSK